MELPQDSRCKSGCDFSRNCFLLMLVVKEVKSFDLFCGSVGNPLNINIFIFLMNAWFNFAYLSCSG